MPSKKAAAAKEVKPSKVNKAVKPSKDKKSKVGKVKRQLVPYDQDPTLAKLTSRADKVSKERTKAQPDVYDAHPTPAKPTSRADKKAARKARRGKKRGVGEQQPLKDQEPPAHHRMRESRGWRCQACTR